MDNMSTPFVSVIIPVYNDSERLKTCLQVLEDQTYPKEAYEVIVVDNGSDESIEPIVAKFSQTKASSETSQRGPCVARNKGLALARGEVIAFTDADCIPAPDWIEKGVANLLRVPNCGIVGGRINLFFKDPGQPTIAELYDSIMHLNQKMFIEKMNFGATANVFTYKHIFDRVGDFDRNVGMSDDKEWGQRVASFRYPLIYAADVRVAHPARHSFDQLRQKVRRVVQGNALLDRKKCSPVCVIFNREFFMNLIPPVMTTIRLGRQHKLSTGEKIKIMGIWLALRCVEIQERVRVMLGV